MKTMYNQYLEEKKIRKTQVKNYFRIIYTCFIFVIGIGLGYNSRNTSISKLQESNKQLTEYTEYLDCIIDSLNQDLIEFTQLKEDGSWYKYRVFDRSGILVPDYLDIDDLKLMFEMCDSFKIPKKYYFKLIHKESKFKINAQSSVGASGYMQLMPSTYNSLLNEYKKIDPNIDTMTINKQNIILGSYLINKLYTKYNDWKLTFAAYNAGPGNVAKYGGIPPFIETINYVNYIIK